MEAGENSQVFSNSNSSLQSSNNILKHTLSAGGFILLYWCIDETRIRIMKVSSAALSVFCVSSLYLRWPPFIICMSGSYTGCQLLANSLDQPSENWQRGVRYALAPFQGTQRRCLTINQVIKTKWEITELIAWLAWLLILLSEVQGNSTCCSVAAVYGA